MGTHDVTRMENEALDDVRDHKVVPAAIEFLNQGILLPFGYLVVAPESSKGSSTLDVGEARCHSNQIWCTQKIANGIASGFVNERLH